MSRGIDDLLRFLVREVALRSKFGAPTDYVVAAVHRFYKLKEDEQSADSATKPQDPIDDAFLDQIWSWLLQNPDIELRQRAGEPNAFLTLAEVKEHNAKVARKHAASEDVAGSKYLQLFASKEQVWRALTGQGIDYRKISALEFSILCYCAYYREEGVLQPTLSKLTGQDIRSIPDRTKKLADLGYLIKSLAIVPGLTTSRLTLRPFYTERGANNKGSVDYDSWQWNTFGKWHKAIQQALNYTEGRPDEHIPWREIREDNPISKHGGGGTRASKAVIHALDRFAGLGCLHVRRNRHLFTTGEICDRITTVRFKRKANEDDWNKFWTLGRSLRSAAESDTAQHRPQSSNEEGASRLTSPDTEVAAKKNSGAIKPLWNPDRTLVDASWFAVRRAGQEGLITSKAIAQITGKLFTRPITNLLGDISNAQYKNRKWYNGGSLTMQHLQVVRDARQIDRHTTFAFYSFENLEALVVAGTKTWKDIERQEPNPEAPNRFEFGQLDASVFMKDPGVNSLTECLRDKIKSGRLGGDDIKPQPNRRTKLSGAKSNSRRPKKGSSEELVEDGIAEDGEVSGRNRKWKRTYTDEEYAAMDNETYEQALNNVTTSFRYHRTQVDKMVVKQLDYGHPLERALLAVREKIQSKCSRATEASVLTQLDVLPEVGAKYRRQLYWPSVHAHMPVWPGPRLTKLLPRLPRKGRPKSRKELAQAAAEEAKRAKTRIAGSKPVKSKLGYYASVPAHSRPVPGRFENQLFVKAEAPQRARAKTAKAAIKQLFLVKKWRPSAAAHTDFTFNQVTRPELNEDGTCKFKKGKGKKNVAFIGDEEQAQAEATPPPAPPQPSFSRAGRERKQTSRAIVSAAESLKASVDTSLTTTPGLARPPQKKSSVGALTYEEQYEWAKSDSTPGVSVGPACSLKRTFKGRGPKALLAVFRSSKLKDPILLQGPRPDDFTKRLVEQAEADIDRKAASRLPLEIVDPFGPMPSIEADAPVVSQSPTPMERGKRKRGAQSDSPSPTNKKARKSKSAPVEDTAGIASATASASQNAGREPSNQASSESIPAQSSAIVRAQRSLTEQHDQEFEKPIASKGLRAEHEADSSPGLGASTVIHQIFAPETDLTLTNTTPAVEPVPVERGLRPTGMESQLLLDLVAAAHEQDDAEMPDAGSMQVAADAPVAINETEVRDEPQEALVTDEASVDRPVLETGISDDPPEQSGRLEARDNFSSLMPTISPVKPLQRTKAHRPYSRKPLTGVTRHGGSLLALRKKIVLGIITGNGGIFPAGFEMWVTFATRWQKTHGQNKPDTRTVSNVYDTLINAGELKDYNYSFKDKSGNVKKKKILLLPEINLNDPRIQELKKNMNEAYPRAYVPPGTEFDPELRREANRRDTGRGRPRPINIGDRPKKLGVYDEEGNPILPPRRKPGRPRVTTPAKEIRAKDQLERELQEANELLGEADFVIAGYENGGLLSTPRSAKDGQDQFDLRMRPSNKRFSRHDMQDAEFEDDGVHFIPLPVYVEPEKRQRAERVRALDLFQSSNASTGILTNPAAEAAHPKKRNKKSNRIEPRIARMPQIKPTTEVTQLHEQANQSHETAKQKESQTIQKAEQTKQKFYLENRYMAKSSLPNAVSISTAERVDTTQWYNAKMGTFGTFLQIPGWFVPKTLNDIFNHAWPSKPVDRKPGLQTQSEKVMRVIDRVEQWEMTDASAMTAQADDFYNFINITLDSELSRHQRKIRLPKYISERKRENVKASGPQHANRIIELKRPGGKRQLEDQTAPLAKRRDTRKRRHRPKDPVTDRRILLAIIMAKILFRAGDHRFVDWSIVERLLGNEYEEDMIRKRYNLMRTPWKTWVAQTKKDLEERFLVAYANGDVPTIHFNDHDATEWTKLMEWVEKQGYSETIKAKSRIKEAEIVVDHPSKLPGSRKDLEKVYKIKDYPAATKADAFEIKQKGIRVAKRREWQHDYPDAVMALQPQVTGRVPNETVARSWVRANAITSNSEYKAGAARRKLTSVPEIDVESAYVQLRDQRWLMKKNWHTTERQVDISGSFVSNFRVNLENLHHEQAVSYKETLDETFKEEQGIDFEPDAREGDMIALLNLFAQDMIRFVPKGIKSTPMGHLKNSYKTRSLDKELFQFGVEIQPTDNFSPIESAILPPKPTGLMQSNAQGLDTSPIPVWMSIHSIEQKTLWNASLNVLFSLTLLRPGLTADELSKYTWPSLENWEYKLLMVWAVRAGIAEWVNEKQSGIKLTPSWWTWFGMRFRGNEAIGV